jgi:hypothetical protein
MFLSSEQEDSQRRYSPAVPIVASLRYTTDSSGAEMRLSRTSHFQFDCQKDEEGALVRVIPGGKAFPAGKTESFPARRETISK